MDTTLYTKVWGQLGTEKIEATGRPVRLPRALPLRCSQVAAWKEHGRVTYSGLSARLWALSHFRRILNKHSDTFVVMQQVPMCEVYQHMPWHSGCDRFKCRVCYLKTTHMPFLGKLTNQTNAFCLSTQAVLTTPHWRAHDSDPFRTSQWSPVLHGLGYIDL